MTGIAPELLREVREGLLACAPVDRPGELRYLFVDERVAAWRNQLPDGDTPDERVQALIDTLFDQENTAEENALALFLEVLAETLDPGTGCHRELLELAGRLRAVLAAEGEVGDRDIPYEVPLPVRWFVGRQVETEMLAAALADRDDEQNIYCLTGMGGVGKTELARRVALQLRGEFRDGIFYGKGDEDPLLLVDSWTDYLDPAFEDPPDMDSRAAAMRNMLADKDVLIVLDNISSREEIERLFAGPPQCRTLITTRNVDLPVTLAAQEVPVRSFPPADALALLAEIVGKEAVAGEAAAAREICGLLGNLPLAVTLAAQQVASRRHWTLADIAGRLRDERRRLGLRMGNEEVRASLAVSLQALEEEERRTFALTAVFQGLPFAVADFASVAGFEDRFAAEDVLYEMVMLSLLTLEEDGLYQQHRLLADLADEELARLGERERAQQAMARHYLTLAEAHQDTYLALEAIWDTVRLALQSAVRLQMWPEVLRFVEALEGSWFRHGHYHDARSGFRGGREAATALGEQERLAHCLLGEGRVALEQNDYEEADNLLLQARASYTSQGRAQGAALANYYLGKVALERAEHARARTLFLRAMDVWRAEDDLEKEGATLFELAMIDLERWDLADAEERARQALALQRRAGDEAGAMRTLVLLAEVVTHGEGALDDAISYCEEALELGERLHHQQFLAEALYTFCKVLTKADRLSEARERGEESLRLFRQLGIERSQAQTLFLLSRIYHAEGKLAEASERGERSLEMCRELGDTWGAVWVMDHLATVKGARGERELARELLEAALALGEPLEHALCGQLRERLATVDERL